MQPTVIQSLMETNFNPLENLAKDLGIDIFDTPPSLEPQPEPSAASSEPNAGDSSLTSDPEPQPQYEPQPEPLGDGSNVLYTQSGYQDGSDDDVSDEETIDFINSYLEDKFGTGLEALMGQTQETDIDERLLPILELGTLGGKLDRPHRCSGHDIGSAHRPGT